ncbi:AraC family transcriptional regulator [candidate division KSB1 bacterium]|nr:AraC family transcriptional regulator [candidate division KSB1 bacterium]
MLLSLLIRGIILSILFVYCNGRTSPSANYLGGFFLSISSYVFIQYVILYSKSVWLITIVFIHVGFLACLIGPMVSWYTLYFREIRKQSFNDFRNQWGVEHAKRLIQEGKASELTLEGIGLSSGFSSRNTFFNALKKFEGVSPVIFVSQQGK